MAVPEPTNESATDEAVIEMHAPRSILADPAIAIRWPRFELSFDIDGKARPRRSSVIGILAPDHRYVFGAFRLHVEVAHDKEVLRQRRIGDGEFDRTGEGSALGEITEDTLLEISDLGDALVRRDMVEVDGIDTQGAIRRLDNGLQRAALQVQLVECAVARQKQVAARSDRITRQDHVAELEAPLTEATVDRGIIHQHVAGRTEGRKVVRKQCGKGLDQIGVTVPAIATGHLLQSDHVRIADAVGDPIRVKTPVLADAILDVVAYELHDTL